MKFVSFLVLVALLGVAAGGQPVPSSYVAAQCSLSGDPHFSTFDGVAYSYLVAKNDQAGWYWLMITPQVSIDSHFFRCNGQAYCADRIRVNVWGEQGTINTLLSVISQNPDDGAFMGHLGGSGTYATTTYNGQDFGVVPSWDGESYNYDEPQNTPVELDGTAMTVAYSMTNIGYSLFIDIPYEGYGFHDDAAYDNCATSNDDGGNDHPDGAPTRAPRHGKHANANRKRAACERTESTQIMFSLYSAVIKPAYSHNGHTCGLCGTLNANQADDFTTPDGHVYELIGENIDSFSASWHNPNGAKRMSCDPGYVPSTTTSAAAATTSNSATTSGAATTAAAATTTGAAATTTGAATTAAATVASTTTNSASTAAVTTSDAATTAAVTTSNSATTAAISTSNSATTTGATTTAAASTTNDVTTAAASTTAAADGTTAAASYASTSTTASSTTAAASTTNDATTSAASTTSATTSAASTSAASTSAASTSAATTTAASTTAATTNAATTASATTASASTAAASTSVASTASATTSGASTTAAVTASTASTSTAASSTASASTAAASTSASATTAAAAGTSTSKASGGSGSTTSKSSGTAGSTTSRSSTGTGSGSGSTTGYRPTTGDAYNQNFTGPLNYTGQNATVANNTLGDYIANNSNNPFFGDAQNACDNAGFPRNSYQYQLCMYDVIASNNTGMANGGNLIDVMSCYVNSNSSLSDCFQGTPFECPSACNGNGKCTNGVCDCLYGYGGDDCHKTGLNAAETAGVVTAAAVVGIAIGAAVFVAVSGYGAKKGYDYLKNKDNNMGGVSSNPLYQEKKGGGTNPLYDTKA